VRSCIREPGSSLSYYLIHILLLGERSLRVVIKYRVRARHIQVYEIETDIELDLPSGIQPSQRQIKEALCQTVVPWRQRLDLSSTEIVEAHPLPMMKEQHVPEQGLKGAAPGYPALQSTVKVPPPMAAFPSGRG
jgi:hypothetical protein